MMLGLILVNLMDWNGGVNDGGLDGLLLDDGLDVLVDVVVNVLADNVLAGGLGVLYISDITGALELSLLCCETLTDVAVVTVLEVSLLDSTHVMCVLFWENLLVLDGLDSGVVMVLVNLAVYSTGLVGMLCASDMLVGNSWVDGLV